jgi:hypothetical protein
MSENVKFTCACCGKELDEWPALTSRTPSPYFSLSEEEKEELAELSTDFCKITYPDQTDYFIRCTLTQKVNDSCQDLEYGVWVSVSEKSFSDYKENYHNPNHVTTYFGWLCTEILGYDMDNDIPTDVTTQTGNNRPIVVPHASCNHPFVQDYYNGISETEAIRRIKEMLGEN